MLPQTTYHMRATWIGRKARGLIRIGRTTGALLTSISNDDCDVKMQAAGFDFLPSYFHHDFALLPNGHVILLTNFTRNFTDLPGYPGTTAVLGDGIVDLDES